MSHVSRLSSSQRWLALVGTPFEHMTTTCAWAKVDAFPSHGTLLRLSTPQSNHVTLQAHDHHLCVERNHYASWTSWVSFIVLLINFCAIFKSLLYGMCVALILFCLHLFCDMTDFLLLNTICWYLVEADLSSCLHSSLCRWSLFVWVPHHQSCKAIAQH